MFDMSTVVSLGSGLSSPMSVTGPLGNLTPQQQSGIKYSSPHSQSPHSSPASTTGSTLSSSHGGKISMGNSNCGEGLLSSDSSQLFGPGSKCKRKINFSHLGIPKGHQPATVARRNARERNRVKQVNNGFAALKQHIPLGHRSKKMSKVETLKCAVEYIKNLKGMLDLTGATLSSPASSVNSSADSEGHPFGGAGSELSSAVEALTSHLTSHHHHHHSHHHSQGPNQGFGVGGGAPSTGSHQLSPTSSEDPSSPSYASEASSYITSSSNNNNINNNNPNSNNNNNNNNMYDYENYEPVSPEDEELLDAISWWQQS